MTSRFSLRALPAAWIFCLLPVAAAAQGSSVWFEFLSNRDGLSSNAVNTVLRDRFGFLWAGTQNGLNVWDGSVIQQFYKNPAGPDGLQYSDITSLTEDQAGTLWIGTNGKGIYRFNRDTGSFEPPADSRLSASEVPSLFCTRDGTLLAGTLNAGLWILKPGSDLPVQVPGTDGIHFISAFVQDTRGILFFSSANGVFSLPRLTGRPEPVPAFSGMPSNALALAGPSLVAGTVNGLVSVPLKSFTTGLPLIRMNQTEIASLCPDPSGGLWIGTSVTGLWFLPAGNTQPERVDGTGSDRFQARIQYLDLDQDNNLWIGLLGAGVAKLELGTEGFKTISAKTEGSRGFAESDVFSVSETPDGRLLAGTRAAGVLQWDPVRSRFTPLTPTVFSPPSSIRALYTDPDGILWVGTSGQGVISLKNGSLLNRYRAENGTLSSNLIRGIYPGSGNRLYICTRNGGFTLLDRKTGTSHPFRNLPGKPPVLGHNNTWSVSEDTSGWVWVATSEGLTLLQTADTAAPGSVTYLKETTILHLLDLKDGYLWGATRQDGIFRFSKSSRTAVFFNTTNGMPSNGVYGLLPDRQGRIWMSTDNGIAMLIPETRQIHSWSVKNGLPGNEFNAGCFFISPSGRFYFGGSDGLISFLPDSIQVNFPPCTPLIRKLTVLNQTNRTTQFSFWKKQDDPVLLSDSPVMVSFDFSGMEFQQPERLRFSYLLKGLTHDWVPVGNHKSIQFTNLGPGTYTLMVRENSGHATGLNDASLTVIIPPAFWQTLWFRILMILVVLGLIYLYIWMEIRRKVHIERLRLRIASDLHDDVGVLLTKISMKSDLLADEIQNDTHRSSLETISRLTRTVIMTMSDSIWSIDSRNDKVANLTDRMKNLCRTVFEEKAVQVRFQIHGLTPDKTISVDIRQNLFLIFKEAVHNCARHSDATELTVTLTQTLRSFTLEISDNGTGADLNRKGSGSGMGNMTLRASRIGAKIQILRNPGYCILLTRSPL